MKSTNILGLIGIVGKFRDVLEKAKMAFEESRGQSVINESYSVNIAS